MASFFQKLWRWLTGQGSAPANGPSSETTSAVSEPSPAIPTSADVTILLARDKNEAGQITGIIHEGVAVLEHAETALPKGSYNLRLDHDSGLHAAYWFRFPQFHKGMIRIDNGADQLPRFLRLGEKAMDAQGGVVVPDIADYSSLYVHIAEALEAGQSVHLQIS